MFHCLWATGGRIGSRTGLLDRSSSTLMPPGSADTGSPSGWVGGPVAAAAEAKAVSWRRFHLMTPRGGRHGPFVPAAPGLVARGARARVIWCMRPYSAGVRPPPHPVSRRAPSCRPPRDARSAPCKPDASVSPFARPHGPFVPSLFGAGAIFCRQFHVYAAASDGRRPPLFRSLTGPVARGARARAIWCMRPDSA